jgi:hypothetical protein
MDNTIEIAITARLTDVPIHVRHPQSRLKDLHLLLFLPARRTHVWTEAGVRVVIIVVVVVFGRGEGG